MHGKFCLVGWFFNHSHNHRPAHVCGTDGLTYLNACVLKHKRPEVKVAAPGACPACPEGACPPADLPVCGSDGVTYGNECELRKEACGKEEEEDLKVEHFRPCEGDGEGVDVGDGGDEGDVVGDGVDDEEDGPEVVPKGEKTFLLFAE